MSFSPSDPDFAPLEQWIQHQATGTYFLWLATHPVYVLTEPLIRPERSYNFAQGSLTAYASTTDQDRSPLTVVVWPPLIGLLILAAVGVYLTYLSKGWRDGVWRMMLMFSAIGVLAMLVAWHGDGQEVTRHTVEGLAQLRLGLWIVILLWFLESAPVEPDELASSPPAAANTAPDQRAGEGGATSGGHARGAGDRPTDAAPSDAAVRSGEPAHSDEPAPTDEPAGVGSRID